MNLDQIKLWLRVDHQFEDGLISSIIESAKSELQLSGVPEYGDKDPEYPLYCTAVKYIIARDYESRGYYNDHTKSKAFNEKGLHKMILKLKRW
ncbi:TPA: phage gp6-like head-tail connector protein [Staphylococcus aureus]|nr:phage gp6-like head-tail connector protein [Staphylococcus aureus]HDD0443981.1 phage gp6-like head-tail connector protein [Staphylococcus aureus]HDD0457875.1 phage gp6-like head-tail connector protein [Staphylococcus aureus]HDD0593186.1 phage gp6-like head-tail connector protein [Staphylococcus aureus]HDD0601350.1 phage gp6-like head-tail connector protein [Staphylococcus aureus]